MPGKEPDIKLQKERFSSSSWNNLRIIDKHWRFSRETEGNTRGRKCFSLSLHRSESAITRLSHKLQLQKHCRARLCWAEREIRVLAWNWYFCTSSCDSSASIFMNKNPSESQSLHGNTTLNLYVKRCCCHGETSDNWWVPNYLFQGPLKDTF